MIDFDCIDDLFYFGFCLTKIFTPVVMILGVELDCQFDLCVCPPSPGVDPITPHTASKIHISHQEHVIRNRYIFTKRKKEDSASETHQNYLQGRSPNRLLGELNLLKEEKDTEEITSTPSRFANLTSPLSKALVIPIILLLASIRRLTPRRTRPPNTTTLSPPRRRRAIGSSRLSGRARRRSPGASSKRGACSHGGRAGHAGGGARCLSSRRRGRRRS